MMKKVRLTCLENGLLSKENIFIFRPDSNLDPFQELRDENSV